MRATSNNGTRTTATDVAVALVLSLVMAAFMAWAFIQWLGGAAGSLSV